MLLIGVKFYLYW